MTNFEDGENTGHLLVTITRSQQPLAHVNALSIDGGHTATAPSEITNGFGNILGLYSSNLSYKAEAIQLCFLLSIQSLGGVSTILNFPIKLE